MKTKLKLLNIFYLLFSVVAIAAYVLNSNVFLTSTFSYTISSELFLQEGVSEDAFIDFGISSEDLFTDLPYLTFEIEVNVTYDNLLKSWTETGPEYADEDHSAWERYAINQILIPTFDNAPDWLEEDLERVADSALMKMIDNATRVGLINYAFLTREEKHYLDAAGNVDPFVAMANNPDNINQYNYDNYKVTLNLLTQMLHVVTTDYIFFNGQVNLNNVVEVEGYKDLIKPYYEAIKAPSNSDEADALDKFIADSIDDIDLFLDRFGIIDRSGNLLPIHEAIGTILQHLVDNAEYEGGDDFDYEGDDYYDDDDYYEAPDIEFVNRLFAPLKEYIEDDTEYEYGNALSQVLVNVIKNSNINGGENNRLFWLMTVAARVFGVILVICLLSWAIKLITIVISFFRQRPYMRINPFFIITGTIEGILALITLATVIIGNYGMDKVRNLVPALQAIIPLGLSIQFVFIAWIPGLMAIMNLLFSILYGPVKRKFKEDSRDEILYSTDFNDYE